MTIREFFKTAGFRPEDRICKGLKEADGTWRGLFPMTVESYCRELEGNLPQKNFYYTHATHSGYFDPEVKGNFKEDNYREIVCLVLDIDYGTHHKKESDYPTLASARKTAEQLPKPTVLIHSGGGLQLVFRFRHRITGDAGRTKFKMLYKTLALQVKADNCQAIGHTFRTPLTWNHKTGAPARPVTILEVNRDADYTLEDLEKWCEEHHFSLPSKGKQKQQRIAVRKAKKQKIPCIGKENSG